MYSVVWADSRPFLPLHNRWFTQVDHLNLQRFDLWADYIA